MNDYETLLELWQPLKHGSEGAMHLGYDWHARNRTFTRTAKRMGYSVEGVPASGVVNGWLVGGIMYFPFEKETPK